MDIDLTLHELRERAAEIDRLRSELAAGTLAFTASQAKQARMAYLGDEMSKLFNALDGHMSRHGCGYAPDAWREVEDHR